MRIFAFLFLILCTHAKSEERPNIVFIIADDASRHFGKTYQCDWVKTPNIDKLATNGLAFDNAYVTTSKCAPCRATLLTGRNPWQIEAGANHQNYFPPNYPAFGEVLVKAGIHTGATGKLWGPGIAVDSDGNTRDFGIPMVEKNRKNAGEPFARFLSTRPEGTPFFYWHGSSDPHRAYKEGSGAAAGKKPEDIDHVPGYWPDDDIVRNDMLDYAIEVERFDSHVGEIVDELERAGLVENTLIIVTSDHGMPFPRVKGHTFDDAHRMPLVMSWPRGITEPGRRVSELVSFIDFAPTFIELHIGDAIKAGMNLTGQSMVDLLHNAPEKERPFVLIGRERNDVYARPGTPAGLGYPARGIRKGDYLYIHNFKSDRWPCGNEEFGFRDTDRSPTKSLIEDLGPENVYWQHCFGKRPTDMLFHIRNDPDCIKNLAEKEPEKKAELYNLLMTELKRQGDPRAAGKGDVFDNYPTVKKKPADWKE